MSNTSELFRLYHEACAVEEARGLKPGSREWARQPGGAGYVCRVENCGARIPENLANCVRREIVEGAEWTDKDSKKANAKRTNP